MLLLECVYLIMALVVVVATPEDVETTGWLDRMVQYTKDKFIEDVQKTLPPIGFGATVAKAPPGYQDSKDWDYDSVVRLLTLIHQSEQAKPVAQFLRRSLYGNTRRIFMSKQESYKFFPKLGTHTNYYDDSDEDMFPLPDEEPGADSNVMPGDYSADAIVIIANPVESRLPSSHISVGMLKEILETRAFAARVMPTVTKTTIYWEPMNTTEDAPDATTVITTTEVVETNSTEDNSTEEPTTPSDADATAGADPPSAPGGAGPGNASNDTSAGGPRARRASNDPSPGGGGAGSARRRQSRLSKLKHAMAKHVMPQPRLNEKNVDAVLRRTIAKQQMARARLQHAKKQRHT